MKKNAFIFGKEYSLIEVIPSLEGDTAILCTDNDGQRFICSVEAWESAEQKSEAPIHTNSSTQEKIEFFCSMFKGRSDLHARRYYSVKTGKSGYTPACRNEWAFGLCDKKKYRCHDCPNREFIPLSAETVKAHLIGRDEHGSDVAAIYPLLEDSTTWLLAIDLDEDNWMADVAALRKVCSDVGLVPAVERSRSGNGAHIWFFFEEPVSAKDARRLGSGLITQAMSQRHELSFSSYDRLFPTQDTLPTGGFGNLIALPFQGQAQKHGNSLFVDAEFIPFPDQWAFLSTLPKINEDQLSSCLTQLCREGDLGTLIEAKEETVPWKHKNTRKKLTAGDFPIQARLVQANMIYLEKRGYSEQALNAIRRLAAFPNPKFREMQAMRKPIYNIPRIIDCGYEDTEYIGLPRGCEKELADLHAGQDIPMIWDDQRCLGRTIDVSFKGALRDNQLPAAQALMSNDIGVLSAATAFGKTVVGAWLIAQRKVNTLILIPSSALFEQWKTALEQFVDIREVLPEPPKKRGRRKKLHLIGQIGSGKNTRSGIIDIAIMQSLFQGEEKDVKSFVAEYGMVIVDECHHVAAFTFEKILKSVRAKYVYGLSATPERKDGHHPIIFMQCGPIRYLVDAKSQAEKRSFSHFVLPRFTRMRAPDEAEIQQLYTLAAENDRRNEMILADALKMINAGRTPILLTERKEHASFLASKLQEHVKNVFLMIGSDGQKVKREKLSALQDVPADEPLAVVATGKYIGEGFDAPRLDTLLLAMPISWKGRLAQYAGRLHRNYEGKQEVRIYDYVDIHIPKLERMYQKRQKGYADIGYQVKFGEADEDLCKIYTGSDYTEMFAGDIADAVEHIMIVCPYLNQNRVVQMLPDIGRAIGNGAKCEVRTGTQPENVDAVNMLKDAGVQVTAEDGVSQRYAVIDHRVVWYGSVDFLSFSKKDANVIRFENVDIAGELAIPTEGEQLALSEGFADD